jgi:Transposase, Mutator family
VNTDGRREILGTAVGPTEAEPFWSKFIRSLTSRGLRGVKLIISDAPRGHQGGGQEGAAAARCLIAYRYHDACRFAGCQDDDDCIRVGAVEVCDDLIATIGRKCAEM